MRKQAVTLPVLIVLMLLASACMPLDSVIISPTGSAPTPLGAVETASPVNSGVETPTPPAVGTTSMEPSSVVTSTLPVPGTPQPVLTTGPLTATAVVTATAEFPAGPTATSTMAPVATPITVTESVTPTVKPLTMTTLRDEVGGFEIDYPANWYLLDVDPAVKRESTGYSITITSWSPQEPGGQGIPEGGSKVDIGVMRDAANTPEEAIDSRRAAVTADGSQITFEEPWELANGLTAAHWTIESERSGTIHEIVTALNGHQIMVDGWGDPAMFESIAASLRPLGLTAQAMQSPGAEGRAAATPEQKAGAQAAQLAAGGQGIVYIVRAGDTLARIAARYGTTVKAMLAANPQITNPDRIYVGQRLVIPSGGSPPPPPPALTRVNIYMIGLDDGSIGCGDSVVAVRRDVPKTPAVLTAALNQLLNQKERFYGESGLYNALSQSNLRIASITRAGRAWTVRLTGTLALGGVCDAPRVKAQLEQTALQFSTVGSVKYFVNGQPLETLLSGK